MKIDRRTFTKTMAAMALGVAGCERSTGIVAPPPGPPSEPLPTYDTAEDRAFGVVEALVQSARPFEGGLRWPVTGRQGGAAYPTDLYEGQAGILAFLAEAYRLRPDPVLRETLEKGGARLRAAAGPGSPALFVGNSGRAWAFLSLHEALGGASREWLDAALALAPGIAAAPGGLIGDLINGTPGQGLFLLRLAELSGDPQWLDAARRLADRMLAQSVVSGGGIKIPSFAQPDGQLVCYTGLSHGSAGAGYFLCRLASELPASQSAAYVEAAEGIAAWLDGLAVPLGAGVNWYRREPDQMDSYQTQWCHGAPGIGIFYAELHRLTGDSARLEMARRCAATTEEAEPRMFLAVQCHGVTGNAELYLKLFRMTADPVWLEKAKAAGEVSWSKRIAGRHYPSWTAGDGTGAENPGLMTGTAGVGWFYLQLALDGRLEGPVTT